MGSMEKINELFQNEHSCIFHSSMYVCPCLRNFRWFMAIAAHSLSFITWAVKKLRRNSFFFSNGKLSRIHQKKYHKFQCSCHRVKCKKFDKIYVRQKWIEYPSQSGSYAISRSATALANKLENDYSLNSFHKKYATSFQPEIYVWRSFPGCGPPACKSATRTHTSLVESKQKQFKIISN